jgi:hypothetical protein
MKTRKDIIKEIIKLLGFASWDVLVFVLCYLKS